MSKNVELPKLVKCQLGGLHVTEQILQQFFHNCPSIRDLTIDEVMTIEGTWDPIPELLIDYESSKALLDLERVCFDGLHDHRRIILFDQLGDVGQDDEDERGFLWREREGLEGLSGMGKFFRARARRRWTPWRATWAPRREWGPP